ncbi:MAG: N-methyl-L-tryptophan oxidase [Phycisphaerales bacterium]|nr:N-methyl-L-tryptophan oxidase [Phycisphaerales bacterium]
MSNTFDAIIVGVGAMGSAACLALAKRGLRVLGIEQFSTPNDRGSSHGATRIIRKAYFEHPDYVPLLHETYDLWRQIENAAAADLFHRVGLLLVGVPTGDVITGVLRSAAAHQLDIHSVSEREFDQRFGMFHRPEGAAALFEPNAGYLLVEECVQTMCALAERQGATILRHRRVTDWSIDSHGVRVTTDNETFLADRLVICGGAWAGRLLTYLAPALEVRRKVQLWFACDPDRFDVASGTPVFAYDLPEGFYYGFPSIERDDAKIAEHSGREIVSDADTLDRELHSADTQRVVAFVGRFVRGATTRVTRHSACMYTMSPDQHFFVDRHPRYENVSFAAGFSGHGFKFAPVIGEILADLAINGATHRPAGFLRVGARTTPVVLACGRPS